MASNKNSTNGFSTGALDMLIYVGMGVLVLMFFKNYIVQFVETLRQGKADELADTIGTGTNRAAEHASQLRNAMNPSGSETMRKWDGTDEAAIFSIARDITDFPAVAAAYRTLYSSALTTDLSDELGSSDYAKFIGVVNGIGVKSIDYGAGTTTPSTSPSPTTSTTSTTSKDKFAPGTPVKTTGGVSYGSGVNIRSYSDITKIVGNIPNDRYAGIVEATINFTNTALATKGRYVFLKDMTKSYFNDGESTRGCIYEELLIKQI